MLIKQLITSALLLASLDAHAELTSYGSEGVDLVYSSISHVTWTKDANLFQSLYDADNDLVSKIAAVTPSYNDSYWGLQTISDTVVSNNDIDDFSTNNGIARVTTWWGAQAFVNYLSSISYGGSNQWRLPTVANTSLGYSPPTNGAAAGNELAELFYGELAGKKDSPLPNTDTFTNETHVVFDKEQSYVYWTGTEVPELGSAWFFNSNSGNQGYAFKDNPYYVWAVSQGQVAAVPEPESYAMFIAGLGLLGFVTRRKV